MKKITTFPTKVPIKNNSAVVAVILAKDTHGQMLGYTTTPRDYTRNDGKNQWSAVWDRHGVCVYSSAMPVDRSRRDLDLREEPTPAQAHYNRLTVDQRAILAALFTAEKNTNHLSMNYLQETLKVDVNLAAEVLTYANKKEFK